METFKEDTDYILNKVGLQGKIDIGAKFNAEDQKVTHTERVKKYFVQLDRAIRQRLFEIYKPDFEMFAYSSEEFVNIWKCPTYSYINGTDCANSSKSMQVGYKLAPSRFRAGSNKATSFSAAPFRARDFSATEVLVREERVPETF